MVTSSSRAISAHVEKFGGSADSNILPSWRLLIGGTIFFTGQLSQRSGFKGDATPGSFYFFL